jgi:hypothetical protein
MPRHILWWKNRKYKQILRIGGTSKNWESNPTWIEKGLRSLGI